ncbi:MAG TPA: YciI family protein [Streptosporangiaceae bacterium]
MKYALLIFGAPGASDQAGPLPAGIITDWVAYTQAVKDSGGLLAAERLAAKDTATCVRVRGDDRLLTDGPFMETKEHLLGFFLVEVPDLDTALDWAARMPSAATGTIEVRAVRTGEPWQAILG